MALLSVVIIVNGIFYPTSFAIAQKDYSKISDEELIQKLHELAAFNLTVSPEALSNETAAEEFVAQMESFWNEWRAVVDELKQRGYQFDADVIIDNGPMKPVLIIKGPSPKKQIANGVLPEDVNCSEGLVLMKKLSKNSVACVTPQTADKLVERGWGTRL